jgi:hypothetical protein
MAALRAGRSARAGPYTTCVDANMRLTEPAVRLCLGTERRGISACQRLARGGACK